MQPTRVAGSAYAMSPSTRVAGSADTMSPSTRVADSNALACLPLFTYNSNTFAFLEIVFFCCLQQVLIVFSLENTGWHATLWCKSFPT